MLKGQDARETAKQSPGEPLDSGLAQELGAALGADLTGVRVHTDAAAAAAADQAGAVAFADGLDLYFSAGAFDPQSSDGRELLLHELAHTVSATGAAGPAGDMSSAGDAVETQADAMASKAKSHLDDGTTPAGPTDQATGTGGSVMRIENTSDQVCEEPAQQMSAEMCDDEFVDDPALEAFLSHGLFGPSTLQAPTGIGGFVAKYDPSGGVLDIRVQGSINFIDGLAWDGTTITSNQSDLDQAAIDGNALPDEAGKLAFLADFQWGADTDAWLTKMTGNVRSTWEGKYSFWVDKDGWDCVIATVTVDIDLVAGESRGDDLLYVETFKCPDDGTYDVGAYVNSDAGDPAASTMVLSSRDAMTSEERTDMGESMLQSSVWPFAYNEDALPADGAATLDTFAADFIDANADGTNPITLTGRASSEGSARYNEDLARRRAQTVETYLHGKGIANTRITVESAGEEGADTEEWWRCVDLAVGDGMAQDVGAHEFGHVFGLTDHYDNAGDDADGDGIADRGGSVQGTGAPAGTLAAHDQLAKDIGVAGGAVYENNDGIQSLGANVEPANYCTFGWALQTITGMPEWKINA
jgi:outer membrane protein OmpA-like peptidoglycan-associated protein